MKKFDTKSILLGIIIGTAGITTVFGSGGIKSSVFSNTKVTFDGSTIPLENSLVEIVKENENDTKLYMPVREMLEKMNCTVNWDEKQNTVNIISNTNKETKEQLQNQIFNINVKSIEPKGYVELNQYKLSAGDNINFNVSAIGKGLSIGFIKSTENVKTANIKYFTHTDIGENASIKSENVIVPAEVAGNYKLYIQSVGENQLTNIKGTIEIIQSDVKTEKIDTKKQDIQSDNNTVILWYDTIDVNILNADNAMTTSARTPLGDKYYYAFGPYYSPNNNDKVLIDIKNGVDGDLFIATSPNKEMTDGVTNGYPNSSTYKGSMGIFTNDSGYYYVIIGAKDFKNLKGTIKIPVYK